VLRGRNDRNDAAPPLDGLSPRSGLGDLFLLVLARPGTRLPVAFLGAFPTIMASALAATLLLPIPILELIRMLACNPSEGSPQPSRSAGADSSASSPALRS
jgi:hypothetical protein